MLHGTMKINNHGHLEIGGCDTTDLAREFGTPLYVFDEATLRDRCRQYVKAAQAFNPRNQVAYAGKAFLTMAVCRVADEEGMALDVVSGGELFTALQADFPAERILFHGNNKSVDELRMALEAGVGRFIVDNLLELEWLDRLAAETRTRPNILLRVTPGIDAHTHAYIQTGQVDSKFGLGVAGGLAMQAIRQAKACRHIHLKGLHCHVGSQIFDLGTFQLAVQLMFRFLQQVRDEIGVVFEELDLGGGVGIPYKSGDPTLSPADFVQAVLRRVEEEAAQYGLPTPAVLFEPGRSIVAEAGTTIYTIGSIKEIPGVRKYVAVDGGMGDNPRVALYQAVYEAVVANKASDPPTEVVSVAGKCCESGDMLIWDISLPWVEPGDLLAVMCTGAYNYSMAGNYNRLPRPPVVSVLNGSAELWVERESYDDLVRNDRIPNRLKSASSHRLSRLAT